MKIIKWFKKLLSGEPHFTIGGKDNPYLLRWYLFPRNRLFNVYLHKFLRDDDDRALHDHPWHFISIMIKGSYIETRPFDRDRDWDCNTYFDPDWTVQTRSAPSIAYRHATDQHRVALLQKEDGTTIPCWTIVLTGPSFRTWGFWCPKGFVPWQDFVDSSDEGNIGKGCGE